MRSMLITSLFLILFLSMGCQDEDPYIPVEIEFQLLDENGNSSVIFEEGENFRFSLIMRNISTSDIEYSPTFIDDDFFRVYKINTSEGEKSMGKPYSNIFCEFTAGHFNIPANDERHFDISWMPSEDFCCPPFCKINNNSPLPKGHYKTFIEGPFEFMYRGEHILIKNIMEIIFEIE